MHTPSRGRAWLAAPLMIGLALAACADVSPTGSAGSAPPVQPTQPPGPRHAQASAEVIGTASIPIPEPARGSDGALPWQGTGTQAIPSGRWALVRVSGALSLAPNSPYYDPLCSTTPSPCYGREGETLNPTDYWHGVKIAYGSNPSPTTQNVSAAPMYVPASGDATVGEYFFYNAGASNVYVWMARWSPQGGKLCYDSSCYPGSGTPTSQSWTEQYRYTGSQTVSVMLVTPVGVTASKRYFFTANPADSMDFSMETLAGMRRINTNAQTAEIYWQWVRNDTLATTGNGVGSFPFQTLSHCQNQPTCRFRPTFPGRMLVSTYLEKVYVQGKSDVVWVNKPEPAVLALTCPDSAILGESITCTAATAPSGAALTVTAWRFTGDSGQPGPTQSGDSKTWTFAPGECGTVTVEGTVDGTPLSDSEPVFVCPFLDDATTDSALNSPTVRRAMRDLWRASRVGDQAEKGAFIILQNGEYSLLPFTGPATRCKAASGNVIIPADAVVVGWVHTHPDAGTPMPYDGTCNGNTNPDATFGDGPSGPDRIAARQVNEQLRSNGRPEVPAYIVDNLHVHRFAGGLPRLELDRNPACK